MLPVPLASLLGTAMTPDRVLLADLAALAAS
jgi:hypothetical protein